MWAPPRTTQRRRDPGPVLDDDRSSDQPHVSPVRVTPGGHERVLRDDDVVADDHVVLVVDPDALAYPAIVADAELPRKANPSAGAEDHAVADVRPEAAQHGDSEPRADLEGIRHEEQFRDAPEVHDRCRPSPGVRSPGAARRLMIRGRRDGSLSRFTVRPVPYSVEDVPGCYCPRVSSRVSVVIFAQNYAPEPSGKRAVRHLLAEGLQASGEFDVTVITAHPYYPDWRYERGTVSGAVKRRGRCPHPPELHYVPQRPRSAVGRRVFGALVRRPFRLSPDGVDPTSIVLVSPSMFACALTMMRSEAVRTTVLRS